MLIIQTSTVPENPGVVLGIILIKTSMNEVYFPSAGTRDFVDSEPKRDYM